MATSPSAWTSYSFSASLSITENCPFSLLMVDAPAHCLVSLGLESCRTMGAITEWFLVGLPATTQRHPAVFTQQRAIGLHDAHPAAQIERAVWLWLDCHFITDFLLWPTVEPLEMERAAGALRNDSRNLISLGSVDLDPRTRGRLEDCWQPLHATMGVDADVGIPGDRYFEIGRASCRERV